MPRAIQSSRARPPSGVRSMIEHLASLPPVQGALDQILHRFGTATVAEVTGRSRPHRAPRRRRRRPARVESRPASANFAETAVSWTSPADLVFSDAGGTGRSYHADRGAGTSAGASIALEPGWKADAAIQGLGRSELHQPEAAAGVPPRRDRRQGREAVFSPRSRAASTAWARSPAASARPAQGLPRRRQSRKPMPRRLSAVCLGVSCRRSTLLARRISGTRDRPRSLDQDGCCARNCHQSRSS